MHFETSQEESEKEIEPDESHIEAGTSIDVPVHKVDQAVNTEKRVYPKTKLLKKELQQ